MNIAIFGDLHGRILLAFWLVKRWQEEHGQTIDQILCVGDVGIYSAYEAMDKASRRFADKYPEELGFSKFFLHRDDGAKYKRHPIAAEVFSAVSASMSFVHGNHEDHYYIWDIYQQFATDARSPLPVDIDWRGLADGIYSAGEFSGWGRLRWLPEGPVFLLDGPWDAFSPSSVRLRVVNGLDKYTMPHAWEAPRPESVDILLSHDVPFGRLKGCHPKGIYDQAGSQRLAEFLDKLSPCWHFFGHMHWPYPERSLSSTWGSVTRSIGMNQLFFETRESLVTPGAFGILSIPDGQGAEVGHFDFVEDDWYCQLRYRDVGLFL